MGPAKIITCKNGNTVDWVKSLGIESDGKEFVMKDSSDGPPNHILPDEGTEISFLIKNGIVIDYHIFNTFLPFQRCPLDRDEYKPGTNNTNIKERDRD